MYMNQVTYNTQTPHFGFMRQRLSRQEKKQYALEKQVKKALATDNPQLFFNALIELAAEQIRHYRKGMGPAIQFMQNLVQVSRNYSSVGKNVTASTIADYLQEIKTSQRFNWKTQRKVKTLLAQYA